MKKTFLPVLLFLSASIVLASCSNGDYSADPSGNANGSVNPLKPLTAGDFTWSGSGKFSVKVNGGGLISTDSAYWSLDTSGANTIEAWTKDGKWFRMYLKDTYTGNVYNLGFKQYNTQIRMLSGVDTATLTYTYYESVKGNSGGIYIDRNDSAVIEAHFYAQTINPLNQVNNLSEGHFRFEKF